MDTEDYTADHQRALELLAQAKAHAHAISEIARELAAVNYRLHTSVCDGGAHGQTYSVPALSATRYIQLR